MKLDYKFSKWNLADTIWQVVITIMMIINWSQSRFASLDQLTWQEGNPLLVSITNTPLKVDIYSSLCLVGNFLVAYWLAKNWRRWWQVLTLLGLIYCVFWAFYDGVGVDFGFFSYVRR